MALPDRKTDEHEDPFYWGSRYVYVEKDGRRQLTEIPLSRDDILDPQEGDILMHGPEHGYVIRELATRLERWFKSQGRPMAVYDSVKILWGVPGISEVAPDVSVIPDIAEPWRPQRSHNSYSVPEEGQLPCLVVEVISPRYQEIDTKDKVQVYRRAKVQEYLIIDITEEPIELTGYRLGRDGRYFKSRAKNRWLSKTTNLWFLVGAKPLEILLEDATTGEQLLNAEDEALLRKAAEVRWAKIALLREAEILAREEAEQRAEEAEKRAEELARRAAEEAETRRALEQELERLRRHHDR